MPEDIYALSLFDIVPSSIGGDPQIQAMIEALDPELRAVSRAVREALLYSRIRELPEEILDFLAWQFHADFYEPVEMDLETKRNIVESALLVHRKKGTPWAVRRMMTDLGHEVEYTEWWQFGGAPYVDRLKIWLPDDFDFTPAAKDHILRAWEVTKAKRTHLESLYLGLRFPEKYPEIEDAALHLRTRRSFHDFYAWGMLYYGYFHYGDVPPREGDRQYGESPDLLHHAIAVKDLADPYRPDPFYGQVDYGAFTYGAWDSGGEVSVAGKLVYGRFKFGQQKAVYGGLQLQEAI